MLSPCKLPLGLLTARTCRASDPLGRLWHFGPRCLDDAELLALVLRTGRPGVPALEIARELLEPDGLAALPLLQKDRLLEWSGIGRAKAASVIATVELIVGQGGRFVSLSTGGVWGPGPWNEEEDR